MANSESLITIIMYLGALMALSEATSLQPQVGNLQELALRSGEVDTVGGSCSYVVKIKTSCSPFAGTDDRISIAFGDAFGNQVYVARLDDPTIDTFERCSTDSFTILGPCVYNICYLYLLRVGSDQWKPEWVRVYYGRSQPVSFYYDVIIPASLWYGFDFCSTVTATQSALSIM